jgi:hypothetical protein
MQFFGHRKATSPDPAYDGPGPAVIHDHADAAELDAAYQRGRRDERSARRRSPLVSLVIGVVAVIGAGTLLLAAREGSFAGGGQLVDHQLQIATGQAAVGARDAAAATGEAVRDAGTSLHDRAAGQAG